MVVHSATTGLTSLAAYDSEDLSDGEDVKIDDETADRVGSREHPRNVQSDPVPTPGSFEDPPSVSVLSSWLVDHGVYVSQDIEVFDSPESGWGIRAVDDLPEYHILCKIPKTSILSLRTTSLRLPRSTPGYEPRSTHSVWFLALALLHELRLGEQSTFYGYIQSLPREMIPLPMFWGVEELCGGDGKLALEILKGTDVEMEMREQRLQGKSLMDLEMFFDFYSELLPPTPSHPDASRFSDYLYAYSLVSTRAFVIDVYHTLALCPFADILNHSSITPHTSLSSDDFVCHICGSLPPCRHDAATSPTDTGIPRRLEHLGWENIRKLEEEEDTVELSVEVSEIKRGEQVFNSYGEDLSTSQLLREWGYFDPEAARKGYLRFSLDEIGGGESTRNRWSQWITHVPGLIAHSALSDLIAFRGLKDIDRQDHTMLGIDRTSGRITLGIWAQVYLSLYPRHGPDDLVTSLKVLHVISSSLSQQLDEEQGEPSYYATLQTIAKINEILVKKLSGRSPALDMIVPLGPLARIALKYASDEHEELSYVLGKWQVVLALVQQP